jgi:hypothetical protein
MVVLTGGFEVLARRCPTIAKKHEDCEASNILELVESRLDMWGREGAGTGPITAICINLSC